MTNPNGRDDKDSGDKQKLKDSLNAKIGVLTRREVEARILKPMLDAMGATFGHKKVLDVMRNTIVEIAEKQGAELAQSVGGNSFQHFAASLEFWRMDDAP